MRAEAAHEAEVLYVEPGQLVVCTEPCRIRTVLGSCISVCLFDPELRHGGMNHFMLPEAASSFETSSRYGNRAMPLLVERMERLGSNRHQLCASVFGGARVLFDAPQLMHLGRRNADFALDWLEKHGITVVLSSVLGSTARRLDFDIDTGVCRERALGVR
jgi:chemotaxis protein CheD